MKDAVRVLGVCRRRRRRMIVDCNQAKSGVQQPMRCYYRGCDAIHCTGVYDGVRARTLLVGVVASTW